MSSQTIYRNPFIDLCALLRSLRGRYAAEGTNSPGKARALVALTALIDNSDNMRDVIDDLERADFEAFEAFHRAVAKAS